MFLSIFVEDIAEIIPEIIDVFKCFSTYFKGAFKQHVRKVPKKLY